MAIADLVPALDQEIKTTAPAGRRPLTAASIRGTQA